MRASEIARAAERKVALTLSDTFCVDRHRELSASVSGHAISSSRASWILSLYECADLDAALASARKACPLVIVTRSEHGSLISSGEETVAVPAMPIDHVVDSTGAGDQYAAGFLFAHARGRSLAECGAIASLAAVEVISHMGPRPEQNLRALALKHGFRV